MSTDLDFDAPVGKGMVHEFRACTRGGMAELVVLVRYVQKPESVDEARAETMDLSRLLHSLADTFSTAEILEPS